MEVSARAFLPGTRTSLTPGCTRIPCAEVSASLGRGTSALARSGAELAELVIDILDRVWIKAKDEGYLAQFGQNVCLWGQAPQSGSTRWRVTL